MNRDPFYRRPRYGTLGDVDYPRDDFATCEHCGRVFHESFWNQSGDTIYCPACRMPAVNVYAMTTTPLRTLGKKPVASVKSTERVAERRPS